MSNPLTTYGGKGYESPEARRLGDITPQSYDYRDQAKTMSKLVNDVSYMAGMQRKMQKGIDDANQNFIQQIQSFINDLIVIFGGAGDTGLDFGDLKYIFQGLGALFGFQPGVPLPLNLFNAAWHFFSTYIIPVNNFDEAINFIIDGFIATVLDLFGEVPIVGDALQQLAVIISDIRDLLNPIWEAVEAFFGAFSIDIGNIDGISGLFGPFAPIVDAFLTALDGINLPDFTIVFKAIASWSKPFIDVIVALINTATNFVKLITGQISATFFGGSLKELSTTAVPGANGGQGFGIVEWATTLIEHIINAASIFLGSALIPFLDATKIKFGILGLERLPKIPDSQLDGSIHISRIPPLPAGQVSSGQLAPARIPPITDSMLSGSIGVSRLPPNIPKSNIDGLVSDLSGINSGISAAQTTATNAGNAASTAQTTATNAGTAASNAQTSATNAGNAASAAQGVATTANNVITDAINRLYDAFNGSTGSVGRTPTQAANAAAGVRTTANTASTNANAAISAAATADTKAVNAATAASTADTKAVNAGTAASTAQTAANTANNIITDTVNRFYDAFNGSTGSTGRTPAQAASVAAGVRTTANNAVSAAAIADGKAITADGKAVAAQGVATAAQTAAGVADGKAVAAQTAANNAATAASTADAKAVNARVEAINAKAAAAQAAANAQALQTIVSTPRALPLWNSDILEDDVSFPITNVNVSTTLATEVFAPIVATQSRSYDAIRFGISSNVMTALYLYVYKLDLTNGVATKIRDLGNVKTQLNSTYQMQTIVLSDPIEADKGDVYLVGMSYTGTGYIMQNSNNTEISTGRYPRNCTLSRTSGAVGSSPVYTSGCTTTNRALWAALGTAVAPLIPPIFAIDTLEGTNGNVLSDQRWFMRNGSPTGNKLVYHNNGASLQNNAAGEVIAAFNIRPNSVDHYAQIEIVGTPDTPPVGLGTSDQIAIMLRYLVVAYYKQGKWYIGNDPSGNIHAPWDTSLITRATSANFALQGGDKIRFVVDANNYVIQVQRHISVNPDEEWTSVVAWADTGNLIPADYSRVFAGMGIKRTTSGGANRKMIENFQLVDIE